MSLATATITYDISDLVGADFDARRTKIWVTTNIADNTIVDTDAALIRVGDGLGTIADDGTGLVQVWIPGDSNPETWQTYLHLDYAERRPGAARVQRTFGPFTVTEDTDLAYLIPEQEVPPTYLSTITAELQTYVDEAASQADLAEGYANDAQDISGITTSDDVVQTLLVGTGGAGPLTRAALNSTIGTVGADKFVASKNPLRWQTNPLHSGGLVITEGDSLTIGAGSPSSTFRTDFDKSLRAALGDGGPGLQPFDLGTSTDRGSAFFKTSGLNYVVIGDGIYGSHFISGLYCAAGAGTDNFTWVPASAWDTVRVLYLRQAGGGTFQYKRTSQADSALVSINTGTVNPDGTGGAATGTRISYFDLTNPGTLSDGLACKNITGNVAIFAGDFKLSTAPRGYRAGALAQGGKKAQEFAAMNMTSRTQWLQALSPSVVVNNLGMNDRTSRTKAQFKADLDTLISTTATALPNVQQLIVMSNEPGDYATTNYKDYPAAKQEVALARGVAYYDERAVLGDYATADAAGFMSPGDAIHPSLAGNRRRAAGLTSALGLPPGLADPGATAYTSGGTTSTNYYGTLTTKRGTWAASATAATVYDLGLINGFPTAMFEVEVFTQRSGTSAGVFRKLTFSLTNGSVVGNASASGTISSALVHQVNAGDTQTLDFTASLATANSRVQLVLTSGSFAGSYVVKAKYTFTTLTQSGTSVIEN